MARILSLLVALVTAASGQALLFWSAYPLTQRVAQAEIAPPWVGFAAIAGVLLIGVSVLTAAWSSLGTWVVGSIELVLGLAGSLALVPIVSALRGTAISVEVTEGIHWYATGPGLVAGAITLAVGAAVRSRRRTPRSGWIARLVSLVVVLVALGPSIVLALTGGVINENRMLIRLSGPDPLGLVLLLVGAVLLTLLGVTVRWSGLGAIVGGAVTMLIGLTVTAVPAFTTTPNLPAAIGPLVGAERFLPEALASGIDRVLGLGSVTTIGMLFLAGGIASVVAGRRVHHRATWVEPARSEPEDAPASVLAPE